MPVVWSAFVLPSHRDFCLSLACRDGCAGKHSKSGGGGGGGGGGDDDDGGSSSSSSESFPRTPHWLRRDLRVRFMDSLYKGGKYYNTKVLA